MRSRAEALAIVRSDLGECTRCKLHKGRIKLVFGTGTAEARLMFVGEGPGAEEDEQGVPFVGRAGQLLTQIIKAMGFEREDVYIANVVKCRPPGNRNPEPDEIEQCEPFLMRQIDVIQPAVVVALGKFAAQTLLRTTEPISRIRGRFHQVGDTRVMPTFHPSYLLRNPAAKRDVWEDMKAVMGVLRDDEPST
jgi:uracil-DNA glycosylase